MTTVPDEPDPGEIPPTRPAGGTLPDWAMMPSTLGDCAAPASPDGDPGRSRIEVVEGQILFGKYRVLRRLGAGAMGEVWLVRHASLKRDHALKVIVPRLAANREALARFQREFEVMASFHHEHAVAIHDACLGEDGGYIDMEYVEGQTVFDLLASARADDRRDRSAPTVPLDTIAHLLGQLCDVLEVAHEAGIVHRDLKPSNLMLKRRGASGQESLKVLDFGIAKIRNDPDNNLNDSSLTGGFIGTPSYGSPEQVLTQPVDGRSDLYSVGVILYEMLCGRLPFVGVPTQVMLQHAHHAPPVFAALNPDLRLPPGVEPMVRRLLDKDPGRRPATAGELFREFCAAASDGRAAIEPEAPTRTLAFSTGWPHGDPAATTRQDFGSVAHELPTATAPVLAMAPSGERSTLAGPAPDYAPPPPPAPVRSRAPRSRGRTDALLVLASAVALIVAMICAGQAHQRLLAEGFLGQWVRIAVVMFTMGFVVIMGVSLHEQSVMRAPRFLLMGHSLARVAGVACIAANLCLILESIYCLVI